MNEYLLLAEEKAAYEEKYIVIMAGDDLPTYLATPAGNKCVCSHEGEVVILEEGDAAKREENKQNERSSTVAWRRPRRLEKTKVRSTNVNSFNFLHQHTITRKINFIVSSVLFLNIPCPSESFVFLFS